MTLFQNFEILHTADSEMMKNSLFNLNAWSGISCPEAKRGSTEARRKEALEEPRILTNGFENKSAGEHGGSIQKFSEFC